MTAVSQGSSATVTLSFAGQTAIGTDYFYGSVPVSEYGALDVDGFQVQNLYRQNPSFVSFTSALIPDGYFYDGPGVMDMDAGGSGAFAMQLSAVDGQPFGLSSMQVDTPSVSTVAAGTNTPQTSPSVTLVGYLASGGTVSQTFSLDSVQGLQTLNLPGAFADLSYVQIQPNFDNIQFDNIVVTPVLTDEWVDGTFGDFSNDADWVSGAAPVAGQNVDITGSKTENITVTTNESVGSLNLDNTGGDIAVTDDLTASGPVTLQAGAIDLYAGGVLDAAQGVTVGANGELYSAPLTFPSANPTVNANIVNDGEVDGDGDMLLVNGSITGTGFIAVGEQGEAGGLELNGATGEDIDLYGGGTLKLDQAASVTGTIYVLPATSGDAPPVLDLDGATSLPATLDFWNAGETLDLKSIVATGTKVGDAVTLTEAGGATVSLTAELNTGNSAAAPYTVATASDGAGGTLVTLVPDSETWTNASGDGNWATASNWDDDIAPGAATSVLVAAADVAVNGAAAADGLTIENGKTLIDNGALSLGGALDVVSGDFVVYWNTTQGTLSPTSVSVGSLGQFGVEGPSTLTVNSNIANDGSVYANGGSLTIDGTLLGTGSVFAGSNSGGAITLNGAADENVYLETLGRLNLGDVAQFTGSVGATAVGDAIDLVGVAPSAVTLSSAFFSLGSPAVVSADGASFDVSDETGNSGSLVLAPSSDGAGGTLLTVETPNLETWVGGVSGAWTYAAGWTSGVAPGPYDQVEIDGSAAETVTVTAPAQAGQVSVADPNAALDLRTDLTTLADISFAGTVILDGYYSTGPVVLTAGGGVTVAGGGELLDLSYGTPNQVAGNVVNNSLGAGPYQPAGVVARNLLITGSLTGTGDTLVQGRLEIGGAVAQTMTLVGGALLKLDDASAFSGQLTMSAGDFEPSASNAPFVSVLDLAGVGDATASYASGVLTVVGASATYSFDVAAAAGSTPFDDATLETASDNAGGTDIYWQVGLAQSWVSGASGDWTNGADWTSGVPAGAYDAASFAGSAAETVSVASGENVSVSQISATDASASFDIAGELTLAQSADFAGNVLNVSGTLNLDEGGTLDNATIDLTSGAIDTPFNYATPGMLLTPTLQFGANAIVNASGAASVGGAMAYTNAGALNVAGALSFNVDSYTYGYSFDVPPSFDNDGSIVVAADATLNANAVLDNTGTLVLDAGASATFNGAAYDDNVSQQVSDWSNSGSIEMGAGSTLTLVGDYTAAEANGIDYAGATLVLDGAPVDDGDLLTISSAETPAGSGANVVTAQGGRLVLDVAATISAPDFEGYSNSATQALTGAAQFVIDAGATLEIAADGQYTLPLMPNPATPFQSITYIDPAIVGTIAFAASHATLQLDRLEAFAGAFAGVTGGDVIDFAGLDVTSAAVTVGASNDDLLTVTTATNQSMTWGINQTFSQGQLQLASDNNGGTTLTFASGPASATVAQYLADPGLYDADPLGFDISDSAAAVVGALPQLGQDSALVAISLTDATEPTLSLTLAEAAGDGATLAEITTPYLSVVSDTAADIAAVTAAEAGELKQNGYSAISAQGPVTLTISTADALLAEGLTVTGAAVTATTTAKALQVLSPSSIAALAAAGVTTVQTTDAAPVLTLAQKTTLGGAGISLEQPYAGAGGEIIAYTSSGAVAQTQVFGLSGHPYTAIKIVYVNGAATAETLTNAAGVYETETWSAPGLLAEVHVYQVTGQSYTDYDVLYSAAGKLASETFNDAAGVLKVETWNAAGALAEMHVYQVTGQPYTDYDIAYGPTGKLASETFNNAAGLLKVETWNAAGTLVELHVYQVTGQPYTDYDIVYGATGKPASETLNDAAGVLKVETWNAAGTLVELHVYQVTGQPYTDYDIVYGPTGKLASETFNNAAGVYKTETWNSSGSVAEVHSYQIAGEPWTDTDILYGANGKLASATWYDNGATYQSESWSYAVDGAYEFDTTGALAAGYAEREYVYNASTSLLASSASSAASLSAVTLRANGQTVAQSAGVLTDSVGSDVFSFSPETTEQFNVSGYAGETLDFGAGFGRTTVYGFAAATDTLTFQLSMFNASWFTPGMSPAQEAQALISHMSSGGNATLTDADNDQLTLAGVTKSALSANPGSIAFV